MKRNILLILACLLLLYLMFRLFFMPPYSPYYKIDSVKEAKKNNVFIGEYKINIIEIFDSTYQLPNFRNIILTGTLKYERNKLGIVRKVPNFEYNKLVFVLDNENNKKFLTVDYSKTWTIKDSDENFAGTNNGIINVIYNYANVNKNNINYMRYTIYLKKNPMSIAEENLIPVLKFKLVPKE